MKMMKIMFLQKQHQQQLRSSSCSSIAAACCRLAAVCFWVYVLLAVVILGAGTVVGVSDVELLLQFKAGIVESGGNGGGGGGSVLANSWLATNVPGSSAGSCPQGWYGVTFSIAPDCFVVALSLSHLSLSGEIPEFTLGNLTHLTSLSLAQNSFTGSIPADLGALSLLQSLDLSDNSFAGVIPQTFASLQSLVNLSLANNVFSGSFANVLQLPQLLYLNLSGNAFSEGLNFNNDVDLVKQAKLVTLDLSNNKLSGPIDPLVTQLPSLSCLNLSSNAFSGSIPPQFGNCISLVALDLSDNQLSGPIPTLDFMEALVSLNLSGNALTGAVPPQFLDDLAPLLQELDLSNNKLSGVLGQVTSITLRVLNLSSNSLEGALPSRLKSCVVIDLSSNLFSGSVPLGTWSSGLEVLNLSNNKLNGTLDDEALMQPFHLQVINLSWNQLAGTVPLKLLSSPSLIQVILSNNQFSGTIPLQSSSMGMTTPLQWLDLSSNNLSGQITDAIGSYANLEALILCGNHLSGSIPVQLSNLTLLQELDVSSNLLTGPIPPGLPAGLHLLNVSWNNLSGTVPLNLTKVFSNMSFFPGNPNLIWPVALPNSSNQGGGAASRSGNKRASAAFKDGLIGGCTLAAVLIVAATLVVYFFYRSSTTSRSTKNLTTVKSPQVERAAAAVSTDLSLDSSADIPTIGSIGSRTATGKNAVSAKPARSDSKSESLDLQKSGDSPMWAKWRGALSSDDSSSLSSEHPTALKVRSPDRLAGDLFFLDASLLFTAEELSHAPAEILGRSSHGTSYKATLENGHMLTVKWLRAGLAKNKKEFTREAKRFGGIKHAHVMPMRGYYWGPREHEKLLLSDYISTGSLANHLYERSGRRYPTLTWEQRLQIAVGIASGLTYLHGKPGLAHGNLKSSNVLLQGPQLHARLVDYGLHHLMTATGTANHILNAGSLGYRSPELAATRKPKPSLAGDVYALGVILMELLTGKGAGDIVSADSGAVDLPDWVRLVVSEGRPAACFDPALVGVHRDQEPPKGMHEVLTIALLCIAPHAMRPNVRVVYDQLASISS
ncbi:unnamed protein product [Sphagnum jensenii]|uniref:Protein kinase domain-containing protein n=1 Tax=Sphagnum jensenii TaxID=128206 RepID=A0ABP1BFB0_9BRYO